MPSTKGNLQPGLPMAQKQSPTNHHIVPIHQSASTLTVNEVILAFVVYAKSYYSVEGCEFEQFKPVLRLLRECCGDLPIHQFGPKALKAVRTKMISKDWSRKVINRRITRIRTMIKWAESEEIVPAGTTHALATVSGLKRGEQGVRDTPGVLPVFWDQLSAVLPFCNRTIQTMLQLQFLTGMRSCEVRLMRNGDIDMCDHECWLYRPASHKNLWRDNGQQRVVPLGPKCQELLRPWIIEARGDGYLFDPQITTNEWNNIRRKDSSKGTSILASTKPLCYSTSTYSRAVSRHARGQRSSFVLMACDMGGR